MKNTKKAKELFENADLDTLVEMVSESTYDYLEKTGKGCTAYELQEIVIDAIKADRRDRNENRLTTLAIISFAVSIFSITYFVTTLIKSFLEPII